MIKRKYFVCRGFEHIAYNCRNMENRREERSTLTSSNRFEVLKSRVMSMGEGSRKEIRKDRKTILRKEKTKKEKPVKVWKIRTNDSIEKKKKLLRKVTVKIGLKQEDNKKGIVIDVLLDSRAIKLVMSLEFIRNNKLRKKKLESLIYIRNIDDI